ncbi:hypothetical protein [Mesorhizobium sp. L48C026A00]|uniref:hypothetical protein n=1 Tax=Mesorhizobium sp. L48C026A00 TaxID=1287182 RepID=UPI001FDA734F|nr:hypothetical protein [Mesorhizobium sp. L48C026A00]
MPRIKAMYGQAAGTAASLFCAARALARHSSSARSSSYADDWRDADPPIVNCSTLQHSLLPTALHISSKLPASRFANEEISPDQLTKDKKYGRTVAQIAAETTLPPPITPSVHSVDISCFWRDGKILRGGPFSEDFILQLPQRISAMRLSRSRRLMAIALTAIAAVTLPSYGHTEDKLLTEAVQFNGTILYLSTKCLA